MHLGKLKERKRAMTTVISMGSTWLVNLKELEMETRRGNLKDFSMASKLMVKYLVTLKEKRTGRRKETQTGWNLGKTRGRQTVMRTGTLMAYA